MKVMIVEDEAKVLHFLKKGLEHAEISVDTASSIAELFSNLLSVSYDVIVLDRLLDGIDSLPYIADIKRKSPRTKIIILSALAEVEEKVEGFSGGADDYLGKPFHIVELLARLRALSRREDGNGGHQDNTLRVEDVTIKLDSQRVERSGKRIELTAKEYKLLVFFAKKPNRIYSKAEIINSVWELQYHPESNVVEVVINHLRNKMDKGFDRPLIHSKRGVGYWLGDKNL